MPYMVMTLTNIQICMNLAVWLVYVHCTLYTVQLVVHLSAGSVHFAAFCLNALFSTCSLSVFMALLYILLSFL